MYPLELPVAKPFQVLADGLNPQTYCIRNVSTGHRNKANISSFSVMPDQISFFSLPADVRLNIYSRLFNDVWIHVQPCIHETRSGLQQQSRIRHGVHLPHVLQACNLLRIEASHLYYGNLKVYFDVCQTNPPVRLMQWLQDIGDQSVRLLRTFEMRWANYVDISFDLVRGEAVTSTSSSRGLDSWTQHARLRSAHQRLHALLKGDASDDGICVKSEHMVLPDLRLPSCVSTVATRTGPRHKISVRGVPNAGFDHPETYWKVNGTAQFCNVLAEQLSLKLEGLLSKDGVYLTKEDLGDFVATAAEHASALRWLWVW